MLCIKGTYQLVSIFPLFDKAMVTVARKPPALDYCQEYHRQNKNSTQKNESTSKGVVSFAQEQKYGNRHGKKYSKLAQGNGCAWTK